MRLKLLLLFLLLSLSAVSYAQEDTLYFDENQVISGEIKEMQMGILTIETDYSDDDFTLEWEKVKSIYTHNYFRYTLSGGRKYYGTLQTKRDSLVVIDDVQYGKIQVKMADIVEVSLLEQKFWDRISASIDIGFNLAKASNLSSLTTDASLGYMAENWNTSATFSSLHSVQDDADEIRRVEGKLSFSYILKRRWYPNFTADWLSNSEQQLDMRQNIQLGMGRYLIRSNDAYWGIKLGLNNNFERYYSVENDIQSSTAENTSWEGFLASELDMFDTGDFSLYALVTGYYSLTERDRWRTDMKIDFKYDLPKDFYIKLGFSLNYDSKPAEGASSVDYVFDSGFGWEF